MKAKKNLFIRVPKTASTAISKIDGIYSSGHTPLIKTEWFRRHDAFKFSCVRNPYEKFVSAYFFIKNFKRGSINQKYNSMSECLDLLLQTDVEDRKKISIVYEPQWSFIKDERDMLGVNYLMRYEILNEDWDYVSKEIYGEPIGLLEKNVTKNKTQGVEDLTKEDRKRIETLYAIDFEKLGY